MKEAAGAPWSCCVSPFIDMETLYGEEARQLAAAPVSVDVVARCEECKAYISPYSELVQR